LIPRIAQNGEITTISLDWGHSPVALTAAAIQSILSLCAKLDARSARVGQCGIYIRLDESSSCSLIRDRVTAILAAPDSWTRVLNRPKFPRQMMVVRGNGDGRAWSYEQQLSPVEVMYESAGT
jgi:hypothetical protein